MSVYGREKEDPKYHYKSDIDGIKKRVLKLRANNEQATPIEIDENGIIHARGFIDQNDNYEIFLKGSKLFYKKEDGVGLQRTVDVALQTTKYESTISAHAQINDAFALVTNPIFVTPLKFVGPSLLNPTTSKEVRESLSAQDRLRERIISTSKGNPAFNHVTLYKSISYKPFNYDVCIKAASEVKNMNDLLVVKTGEWQYAYTGGGWSGNVSGLKQEKIVFVTPHEIIRQSGVTINPSVLTTGTKSNNLTINPNSGILTGEWLPSYSGAVRNIPQVVLTGINTVSSKNYIFESGKMLSGGATYTRRQELYSGITGSNFSSTSGVTNQVLTGYIDTGVQWEAHTQNYPFYKEYSGRAKRPERVISGYNRYGRALYDGKTTGYLKDNFATSYDWDGVIPSGTPFKLEYWSTDGKTQGHEGEFLITPCNWNKTMRVDITGVGVGVSTDSYEEATNNAGANVQRFLSTKLNALYVLNGIITSGSDFWHYNDFLNGYAGYQKKNGYDEPMLAQSWTGSHGHEIANFITGGGA
jgi:hypothetical protein